MYAAGVEVWGNNLSAKDVDITSAQTIWYDCYLWHLQE
jgi:hypothetical protein